MNEKYSYKDFTGKILTNTDPLEWNDTEVIGSCFAQETPRTQVFPDGITGVTFTKCNLDNCIIPKSCRIEGGCNRAIQIQNDLEDWLLNDSLEPIEPMNKAEFSKLGLEILPISISTSKLEVSVTQAKRKELEDLLAADHASLDDAAKAWR